MQVDKETATFSLPPGVSGAAREEEDAQRPLRRRGRMPKERAALENPLRSSSTALLPFPAPASASASWDKVLSHTARLGWKNLLLIDKNVY
ncbi:uncharacterized protein [Penaeus vannamei]|uniref:uncharacterized protein isoform X4 n=1 Tax=Penaeus vannamei TaxID=6689 RepID=UPI00387F99BF